MSSPPSSIFSCARLMLHLTGVVMFALFPRPGSAQTLPNLPQVSLDTTYARPAGQTLTVNAGGSFQTALNSATCGDTIVLQAGASFPGPFYLPNRTCTGWVYIQSSAYTFLPPPGTRVSPSDAANMPKLVVPNNQSAALITWHGNTGEAPNPAHHYRFVGIEMAPAPGVNTWAIVYLHANNTTAVSQLPHDITFDRVYIHGDPNVGAAKAIVGNVMAIAVVDSWISDIKSTTNPDTQTFNSWNTPGPIKLVNNHLEAAGENVLVGGAAPMIPNVLESDIEIRRNHFYKPVTWNPHHPSYAGTHWLVKNSLEFKHGLRVLVEGNVFENCWADAQGGGHIVLHPTAEVASQAWIQVSDVTIRYNLLKNAGTAFVLFGNVNNPPYPAPGDAQPSQRILIQNNLAYHMGWQYSVGGVTKLFEMDPDGGTDFTIDHNTALFDGSGQAGLYFNTDGLTAHAWANFTFTNNILNAGSYPVGAPASGGFGSKALDYTTTNRTFARNAQIGPWPASGGATPSMFTGADYWSLGFPANVAAVQFTNVATGDYSLAPGSPYNNAGTDGKDIGVDMDALNAAMSGTATAPTQTDTIPPAVAVTAPTSGATISGTVTVSATASDNVGVAGVQFQLDGTALGAEVTVASYSISWDTAKVASGSHTITAVARDPAGNRTTSAPVPVTVSNGISDTTPPSCSVVINNGAAYTAWTAVTLSLASTDNVGVTGYYVSTSSTPPAPTATGWVTIASTPSFSSNNIPFTLPTGDGTKKVYAWYKDARGNVSAPASASILLDQTLPSNGTLSVTTGNAQVTLNWMGFSDGGSGLASSNSYKLVFSTEAGSPTASCTSGTQLFRGSATSFTHTGLTNGTTYFYRVCAFDNAGNVSTGATASGTPQGTDTTAPTVTITPPTTSASYSTSSSLFTLAGTASDNVGVTQVTWANSRGGSGTASGTTSWTASGIVLKRGNNVLTVTAKDAAGNTGTATLTVAGKASERIPPTVTITSPTTSASYSTSSSSSPKSTSEQSQGVAPDPTEVIDWILKKH